MSIKDKARLRGGGGGGGGGGGITPIGAVSRAANGQGTSWDRSNGQAVF